jgi:hypothetical protein
VALVQRILVEGVTKALAEVIREALAWREGP